MGLSAGLVFRLWLNSEPGRDQLEILNLEQLPPEFFLLKIFSLLSRLGKITVSTTVYGTARNLPASDRPFR